MVIPVEFHVVEYVLGDEVEVTREPISVVPSNMNWIPVTPTSSVAVAERDTEAPTTVAPLEGRAMKTEGGVISFVANDKILPVLVPAEFVA